MLAVQSAGAFFFMFLLWSLGEIVKRLSVDFGGAGPNANFGLSTPQEPWRLCTESLYFSHPYFTLPGGSPAP